MVGPNKYRNNEGKLTCTFDVGLKHNKVCVISVDNNDVVPWK